MFPHDWYKVPIPIIFVLSSFAAADEKPVHLLETKVTFEGIDVTVSEVNRQSADPGAGRVEKIAGDSYET